MIKTEFCVNSPSTVFERGNPNDGGFFFGLGVLAAAPDDLGFSSEYTVARIQG